MQTQMSDRVGMAFIAGQCLLMRRQLRQGVGRENMVLVIKFMREYLAVERPAKGVRHHADEQHHND